MKLDPDLCYAILASRDPRFDGLFFVGVKTTGIYCRSICPARTPKPSSCTFYATHAAAEEAGFRPCLRCRPELAPTQHQYQTDAGQNLPHAIYQHLKTRATSETSLNTIAAECGFSERHLRRLMMEHFGVPPISILQTERLLFAKKLLQETTLPMIGIAASSGFGSLRRFNALFKSRYKIHPSALRKEPAKKKHGETIQIKLSYRPPFSWPSMLSFLKTRAIPGIEEVIDNTYSRSIVFGDISGILTISEHTRPHQLTVEIPESLSPFLHEIITRLKSFLDLEANPSLINEHLCEDPFLKNLISKQPDLRIPGAWDLFEIGVRAIIGQQVSVAGASTITGRFANTFGAPHSHSSITRLFPSPNKIAALKPEKIAALGMPASRAETLHRFAIFATDGGLDFNLGISLEEVVSRLTSLKGIGEWTALYFCLRALRFPDAFPASDLGLRKALGGITARELEERSQTWRRWRAYAVLHLWNSLSLTNS